MTTARRAPVRNSPHEERVQFLNTIAILLGCKGSISCALPDGRRPDVLRFDQSSRLLFLGEAKDAESPQCHETAVRFQRYLQWFAAHVMGESRVGIVAVCFGRERDGPGWLRLLNWLSIECSLPCAGKSLCAFGPGLYMAWSLHRVAACLPFHVWRSRNLLSTDFRIPRHERLSGLAASSRMRRLI